MDFAACYEFFFRVPLFYCLFEYLKLPIPIFIIKGKVLNRDTLINKKNNNHFLRSLFIIFFSLLQTMRRYLCW